MAPTSRRFLRFALPTVAALGAGAAVGVAAIPSADGTIHACVTTATGAVRIINAEGGATCTAADRDGSRLEPAGPARPGRARRARRATPAPASGGSTPDTSSGAEQQLLDAVAGRRPDADMFLKLDGITGDSTDDEHKSEINAASFAFALGRGGDGTGSGGARRRAGRLGPPADAARSTRSTTRLTETLPRRRQRPAHQERGPDLPPLGRRPRRRVPRYTLSDVQVTSYDQGGKDGDARDLGSLEEEVGLTAAKVHLTEQTVDSDGKKGPVLNADWTLPKAPAAKQK